MSLPLIICLPVLSSTKPATRNDWATAGRTAMVAKPGGTQTSPLLLAAMAGRIEAVEWFLSDTPSRQYLAFAKSKAARDDVKLKHLAQAPGGFDGAISKWLDDQSTQAPRFTSFLHCRTDRVQASLFSTLPSSPRRARRRPSWCHTSSKPSPVYLRSRRQMA